MLFNFASLQKQSLKSFSIELATLLGMWKWENEGHMSFTE